MSFRRIIQYIVCLVLSVLCVNTYAHSCEEVVTGTSLVGEMIEQMIGSLGSLHNLLPPNMCPGHYDMRPGDIEAVSACRLLLLQPWQRNMPNIEAVIRASKIPDTKIRVISVPGNWMIPATRCEAARGVCAILIKEFPEKKTTIEKATKRIIIDSERVGAWGGAEIRAVSSQKVNVLSNEQQVAFVRWLGFAEVQSYGRSEGLSVSQLEELTSQAKKNRIALVVDNLQSGDTKMGESLARDTGAVHVVLSNFPGAEKGQETWEQTFKINVERIVTAITQWRSMHHD